MTMLHNLLLKLYIQLRKCYFKKKFHVKFSKNCIIDSVSVFGEKSSIYGRVTDSQIEAGVAIYGSVLTCNIGKGSYVADNSFLENCSVGKYTSIGQRVNIIRGGHPAKDWVSTSPSFFH